MTGDYDKYLDNMAKDRAHGSDQEVTAMAHLYERRIEIFRDNLEEPSHLSNAAALGEPIRLKYTREKRHYEVILEQVIIHTD